MDPLEQLWGCCRTPLRTFDEESDEQREWQLKRQRVDYLMRYPFDMCVAGPTADLLRQSTMSVLEALYRDRRLILKPGERIETGTNMVPQLVNMSATTHLLTTCAAPSMALYGPLEDKHEEAPITLSLGTLSKFIAKLDNSSKPLSVAWKEARNSLRDLGKEGVQPNDRTHARVLNILREAREKASEDREALIDLSESLQSEPLEFLELPFKRVYVHVCRIIGIAGTDETEWDDLQEQVGDISRDLYYLINVVFRNISKAGKTGDTVEGILMAEEWGKKTKEILDRILEDVALQGHEQLMEEEEEWLSEVVEIIGVGTCGQSREPGETTPPNNNRQEPDDAEDGTKYGSQDDAEDGSEDDTKDGSEDDTKDGSEDDAEGGSEDDTKDGSEDDTEDGSEDDAEGGSEDDTKDGGEEDTVDGGEEDD